MRILLVEENGALNDRVKKAKTVWLYSGSSYQ